MLKAFLLAGLAYAVSAAPVHEFMAESKFICRKCVAAVDYFSTKGDANNLKVCKNKYGWDYTPVCQTVISNLKVVHKLLFDGKSSKSICEELELCGDESDTEYSQISAYNVDLVRQINNDPSIKWKASVKSLERWSKGGTLKDVRKELGTIVDPKHIWTLGHITYNTNLVNLPTDFDSRTEWPDCADVIGHIRDQSACGCCWAFGSTEAYNDRMCIVSSDSSFQQLLSVEDTCACCRVGSDGCDGGNPGGAWDWFVDTGIVSGGDYDDIGKNDTCDPFTLPPCAHHVNSTEYPPCPTTEYSTPKCKEDCSNTAYPKDFDEDKHKASKAYSLRSVDDMMTDLQSYGTITAGFTVYEDFLSYTSGVYVHKYGRALGGHAIKIFGWGVEDGEDYWWCANSWNDSWGDNGFFKILKGADECGIESEVSAGRASS